MSPRGGYWVKDPGSGGKPVPTLVQIDVIKRINRLAEEQCKGLYTRLDIHFRGQFCYIDAYTEPTLADDWPPADLGETHEEALE